MDKQHILEEIKRTAIANSGVPLGRSRFAQETGIKEYDWQGKYWARWGDAVREAGFAPNPMRSAYDETLLIEKFISLVRELGRFPVAAEVRMKAHKETGFPSHNTFSRLGSKKQLVARIKDYCKGRADCEDVLALCAAAIPDTGPASSDDAIEREAVGFVYLIKSGRYYKVGRTNAAGRREYELAIQLPEKANTVHVIKTDDPAGIEAYWHKRFEAKWKNGEWFELSKLDVKAFKRRKFM